MNLCRSLHRRGIPRTLILLGTCVLLMILNIMTMNQFKSPTQGIEYQDRYAQRLSENIKKHLIQRSQSTITRKTIPKITTSVHRVPPVDITNKPIKKTVVKARKNTKFDPMKYPLEVDMKAFIKKIMEGNHPEQEIINPHPYTYIHNPSSLCGKNALFILVLVKSRVDAESFRATIRKTWGSEFVNDSRIVFLLGMSSNSSVQEVVKKESDRFGDIVQENFLDEYCNNTLKTIMGFNWATDHCGNARYNLFVDDDMFVSKQNLEFLKNPPISEKELYMGKLFPNSVPYRDNGSKWFISWEEYPFDRWPPYFAGGAFITSAHITRMLYTAFPYVKYIGIDDSYLGIVAKKLDLKLTNRQGFIMRNAKTLPARLPFQSLIAYHGVNTPDKILKAWESWLQYKDAIKLAAQRRLHPKTNQTKSKPKT